jgi:hypothetical protein
LAAVACGGSSKKTTSEDGAGGDSGSSTGGFEAGGTSGASGASTGGSAIVGGTSGSAGLTGYGVPRFVAASRQGDLLQVTVENHIGAYERTCFGETSLAKANGERFVDNRPACGIPYYLADSYEENLDTEACHGCDVVSCVPYPPSRVFISYDVLQTGVRPPPDSGAGGGSDAGIASSDIPVFERVFYPGPYTLTIRYFTDSSCTQPIQEKAPITFALADDL